MLVEKQNIGGGRRKGFYEVNNQLFGIRLRQFSIRSTLLRVFNTKRRMTLHNWLMEMYQWPNMRLTLSNSLILL